MRVTKDTLINAAKEYVKETTSKQHNVLCAYLCGSVLGNDPLLGEAGDIDLVFVHFQEPTIQRQIIRLNDQIHLDIVHHSQRLYNQPRTLRQHAWFGPTIYNCYTLYDPQHTLDFTIASVRGQYHQADVVYERARSQLNLGRKIWHDLCAQQTFHTPQQVMKYLEAIEKALNAVVLLTGDPLAERRLLLEFPKYAENLGYSGLPIGALGLLGGLNLQKDILLQWMKSWEEAYHAVNAFKSAPIQLHPHRFHYYSLALQHLINSPQPANALYLLLHTWTLIACTLQADNYHQEAWKNVCQYLGIIGEALEERHTALDAYFDTIEELFEEWGRGQGVQERFT